MYATAHTVTLLMAILAFMPQSPSLRVLLIEDSALLAARLIELVNPLPEVDLIDTVDTEAEALDRSHPRLAPARGLRFRCAAFSCPQHPAAPENHRPDQLRFAGISSRSRVIRCRGISRQVPRVLPPAVAVDQLCQRARRAGPSLTEVLRYQGPNVTDRRGSKASLPSSIPDSVACGPSLPWRVRAAAPARRARCRPQEHGAPEPRNAADPADRVGLARRARRHGD
jgi:hypothetical protein